LVLDSELRATSVLHMQKEDILFRILNCSGWMRRLWTLQEGLAAGKSLYIAFSDAILNIPEMADKAWRKHENGRYNLIASIIPYYSYSQWFAWFRTVVYQHPSLIEKLFDAGFYIGRQGGKVDQCTLIAMSWDNIAARATSRDEDRPIILAGIVNLDPGPLLQIRGNAEERMKAFYNLMKKFPQGVIFQPGPKFEDEGWGWAPKKCRVQKDAHTTNEMDMTPGLRRKEGLVVKYPGIIVNLARAVEPIDAQSTTGYLIAVDTNAPADQNDKKQRKMIYIFQDKDSSNSGVELPDLPAPTVAVVFAEPLDKVKTLFTEEVENFRIRCLVLVVHRAEDKIQFGKILMRGMVIWTKHDQESWDRDQMMARRYVPHISAEDLKDQSWCIG
jgi:hypothetical protein